MKYQTFVKGKTIDIGAGNAPYRKYFGNASEYITTNTKRHYENLDINTVADITDIWIDDGADLPVNSDEFDSVVCFQVMSVIKDPNSFFKEVHRVLKKGGVFMLTTDFLYPKWSDEDMRRYTDFHLKQLAEENGFRIEEIESFGGFWTMLHCNINRYYRSYPDKIKQTKSILKRILRSFTYFFVLLLLPLFQLLGWLIFVLEKGVKAEFEYSVNNLLIARKL